MIYGFLGGEFVSLLNPVNQHLQCHPVPGVCQTESEFMQIVAQLWMSEITSMNPPTTKPASLVETKLAGL
jgi:hypothetical protein